MMGTAKVYVQMNFSYSGLSLGRTKGLFGRYGLLLSAQHAISVIDTKTGKRIGYGSAHLPPSASVPTPFRPATKTRQWNGRKRLFRELGWCE